MSPTKAEILAFAVRLDEHAKRDDTPYEEAESYRIASSNVYNLVAEYPRSCITPKRCAMAGRCMRDPVCNN